MAFFLFATWSQVAFQASGCTYIVSVYGVSPTQAAARDHGRGGLRCRSFHGETG